MLRNIKQIIEPESVIEGAGVRLKRSIGTATVDYLDPFLLFDDFTSGDPMDYQAGFPLHPHLVVLDDGDTLAVRTEADPVRFLLVSGKPLGEPIARYGPFVMNTKQEIEQTLLELRQGTFITT